jgi:hypothetical protein
MLRLVTHSNSLIDYKLLVLGHLGQEGERMTTIAQSKAGLAERLRAVAQIVKSTPTDDPRLHEKIEELRDEIVSIAAALRSSRSSRRAFREQERVS